MDTKIKIKYLKQLDRKNNLVLNNEKLHYQENIKNIAMNFKQWIEGKIFDLEIK